MGCGSSKASALEDGAANGGGKTKRGRGEAGSKVNGGTAVIRERDVADLPGSVPESEPEAMPSPITFEIPAVHDDNSIVKKHPPKRLQKLEEQQIGISEDRLLEKQTEAKERRQKLLQERVSSSRLSAHRGGGSGRRTRIKDTAIPEQIEHEKSAGSPAKRTPSDALEF